MHHRRWPSHEFLQNLETDPARHDSLFRRHRDLDDLASKLFRNHLDDRRPLSADRSAVAKILDIDPGIHASRTCLDHRSHLVLGIGGVGTLSSGDCKLEEFVHRKHGRSLAGLEVPSGFEPLNIGFADRPLRPLGHGTSRGFLCYLGKPTALGALGPFQSQPKHLVGALHEVRIELGPDLLGHVFHVILLILIGKDERVHSCPVSREHLLFDPTHR